MLDPLVLVTGKCIKNSTNQSRGEYKADKFETLRAI